MTNSVFIATSLDGYIADRNNGIDWLHSYPNPDDCDGGFADFMERIDGLVMGRNTFELVKSFEGEWPYSKPVFVLSHSMTKIPDGYEGKVEFIKGELREIVQQLDQRGFKRLYIDGGVTIQNFLKEDLIDEMVITTVPIILGGGIPLFGALDTPRRFKHIQSQSIMGALVQSHYRRESLPD
ncbi:dihydrofolate reductase family protein [Pleionea sp. CnH1-48]|uniref:dihydrofolate reductase family protein n=1 Tax=Pleionea sp. CnH1-48 TaxID=2954494 RepID=UPI00209852E5|nr:dihydrofolate reductase family protein [Pleionea sp. CnH1-48]MCO7223038.1 dihydrofolate reductase family protein [Pleionea sp. CnH1-48]